MAHDPGGGTWLTGSAEAHLVEPALAQPHDGALHQTRLAAHADDEEDALEALKSPDSSLSVGVSTASGGQRDRAQRGAQSLHHQCGYADGG